MKKTFPIYFTIFLIFFFYLPDAVSQPSPLKKNQDRKTDAIRAETVAYLNFIDPGVTPFTGYRWCDVAGNLYSDSYRTSYRYDDTDVQVQISFEQSDSTWHGQLSATHLKPNFAYQLKLNGISGMASNERIGLAGRWWQEEWDGSQWSNGQNLNNKDDGTSPNPNDLVYFARRDVADATSPTGLHYRYTGYLVFDYFITDENGDALLDFEANSSYHVLWNTIQTTPSSNDGPSKTASFDPDPAQTAYDYDYPAATMTIFGEWERLPVGEVYLATGNYDCQIILTEESFHGWPPGGSFTGQWAAAMGTTIQFTIVKDDPLPVQLSSFYAEAGNSSVFVRWVTESELNHAGFELLRSLQQTEGFSPVSDYRSNSDLAGQGNSSIKHDYAYIDCDVVAGQSYWYKLVDIDLSGQRTYHGPVHVFFPSNKGLNHLSSDILEAFILYTNFPNPFNSITMIRFDLPSSNQLQNTISLAIYNSSGQKVRTLYQGYLASGSFEIAWDGRSDRGLGVASGIYFVVLNMGGKVKTGKIMLMK